MLGSATDAPKTETALARPATINSTAEVLDDVRRHRDRLRARILKDQERGARETASKYVPLALLPRNTLITILPSFGSFVWEVQ